MCKLATCDEGVCRAAAPRIPRRHDSRGRAAITGYIGGVLAQTTHATLLARLSDGQNSSAWQEFCQRYGQLIRSFARHQNVPEADHDDVLQDVLMALTKAMPRFEYDPTKGKFRSYLKTVALHAIYKRFRQNRGERTLEDFEAAVDAASRDASVETAWETQWRQYHLRQAMRRIESEFCEADRIAFEQYALGGCAAAETAKGLGISVDSVYQAKSRILKRIGQLIAEQIEEEG